MASKFSIEDACFEDAYVKGLSLRGGDLRLDLECFAESDEPFTPDKQSESVMIPVSVTFRQIRNLTIDGMEASTAQQLMKDGSIEYFERDENAAKIFVDWRDYDAKARKKVMYEFDFLSADKKTGEKFLWRWKNPGNGVG